MENRNIYKMDDVLIILSYLMLIPCAFFAWPWLRTLQDAADINSFFSSAPGLQPEQLIKRRFRQLIPNLKKRQRNFIWPLFIILFLTPLWPAALIYAISYAVRQNKIRLSQRDPVNPE